MTTRREFLDIEADEAEKAIWRETHPTRMIFVNPLQELVKAIRIVEASR